VLIKQKTILILLIFVDTSPWDQIIIPFFLVVLWIHFLVFHFIIQGICHVRRFLIILSTSDISVVKELVHVNSTQMRISTFKIFGLEVKLWMNILNTIWSIIILYNGRTSIINLLSFNIFFKVHFMRVFRNRIIIFVWLITIELKPIKLILPSNQ